jgi:hypothetical protein
VRPGDGQLCGVITELTTEERLASLEIAFAELKRLFLQHVVHDKVAAEHRRAQWGQLIGGEEDYLATCYDKSLLEKRQRKVRSA